MILDTLPNADIYQNIHPLFKKAFEWLRSQPLATLEEKTYEIDGKRLYASVQSPAPKGKADCKLECHRKYIDIQYCISGQEEMGWGPVEGMGHALPFQEESDFGLFEDAPLSWVDVRPGSFAIFFPGDAHAPNASSGTHRKVVIKVLL